MQSSQNEIIDNIKNNLRQSQTGAELLKFCEQHNVKIEISDDITPGAVALFNIGENIIKIPSKFQDNTTTLTLLLAHELRHAWQFHSGLLSNTRDIRNIIKNSENYNGSIFKLYHASIIEIRFAEADAFATSTQVSYELLQKNIISNTRKTPTKDAAYPILWDNNFNKSVKKDKNNGHNGIARRIAFDTFFQQKASIKLQVSLRQGYDINTTSYFMDVMAYLLQEFDKRKWHACMNNETKREELKAIFNTSAKDSRKKLPSIEHLNKYGHMETGGNYLTDHNRKSLHSKLYVGSGIIGNYLYKNAWGALQNTAQKIYNHIPKDSYAPNHR